MELNRQAENGQIEEGVVSGNLMDSRTSQLDDVLNEKLEEAFHKPTSQFMLHDIAKIASEPGYPECKVAPV